MLLTLAATLAVTLTAEPPRKVVVTLRDHHFSAPVLTLTRGDVLEFQGAAGEEHVLTFEHDARAIRGSFARRFQAPGATTLRCTVHPDEVLPITTE